MSAQPESNEAESKKISEKAYAERKITQLRQLKTVVWGLDLDEGIRFIVDMQGYKNGVFIFVTKCDDKYCANIKERVYDEKLGQYVPGEREQWKYFETAETAWAYLSKLLKTPIEAYYY